MRIKLSKLPDLKQLEATLAVSMFGDAWIGDIRHGLDRSINASRVSAPLRTMLLIGYRDKIDALIAADKKRRRENVMKGWENA